MDISFWYSVALAATFAIFITVMRLSEFLRFRFSTHDNHYLLSRARSFLSMAILPRRFFSTFTILHAFCFLTFITGNGLATGLSLYGLEQLQHRAAILGSANILPAFIGRRLYTNSFMGISVRGYYLIHSCLAVVGIVQVTLHAGLALRAATMSTVCDRHLFYSGLAGLILLTLPSAILLLLSIPCLAGRWGRWVRLLHTVSSRLSVPVLCWHIIISSQTGKIAASIAGGLWAILLIYPRLYSAIFGKGDVFAVVELGGATVVQLRTNRAMKVYPGCYFFIIPSVFSATTNSPHIVYHWENIDTTVKAYSSINKAKEFHLIVQNTSSHLYPRAQVLLDGPYGCNTHAEKYDTVVLVAEGRGIAGVLSAALYIAQISRHSRITRRIDLHWKLDHNDKEEWAEESLQNLIRKDPHRSLFAANLYYPRLRVRPLKHLAIPDKHSKQWNTFRQSHDETMNRIRSSIDKKSKYAGHMIVIACGDIDFREEIQGFVYRLPTLVKFAEVGFQGRGSRISSRDIHHIPMTMA